jgi:hypothetical protein
LETVLEIQKVNTLTINHQSEEQHEDKSRLSMQQKLFRILQVDQHNPDSFPKPDPLNDAPMITRVLTRPNPFTSSITVEVACAQSKHVIVRMFDEEMKIVKMFSWFLVKGINVTTISEVNGLSAGSYTLDIVDLDGDILYGTKLQKSE